MYFPSVKNGTIDSMMQTSLQLDDLVAAKITGDKWKNTSANKVLLLRPPSKSARKTVCKLNCLLLCSLCCVIHLMILSVEYFKFETIALYGPYIPFEQKLPSISICYELKPEAANLTNVDLLNEIEPSKVMRDCYMRNFTSKKVESIDCSQGFVVDESIRKNLFNCYAIRPSVVTNYTILDVTAVLEDRRVLYTFFLSDLFTEEKSIMLLMHFKQRPEEEFSFSRTINVDGRGAKVFVELGYELIENLLLPPPYDTKCIIESACLDKQGKRYPWCKRDICVNNETITHTRETKSEVHGILLQIGFLASPSVRMSFNPLKRPDAFFLEICSLLGLWVSFSIHAVSNWAIDAFSKVPFKTISPKKTTTKRRTPRRMIKSHDRLLLFSVSSKTSQRQKGPNVFKYFLRSVLMFLFIRELSVMSIDYFEYKTHMYITIQGHGLSEYPSVSQCIDIFEWFKIKVSSSSRYYTVYDEEYTKSYSAFNYTLKDIFESTPDKASAIHSCQVRNSASDPLVITTECSQFFEVEKFFYGQFICYNFRPKMQFIEPDEFEHDTSVIYSIILNEKLTPIYHHQAIVSYGIPTHSRLLATDIWKVEPNELVELYFKVYKWTRLPPPYDTQCSGLETLDHCEIKCMNVKKIGLIPFSNVFMEPIDMPLLNYVHLKNNSVANYIQEAEDRCNGACGQKCRSTLVVTLVVNQVSNFSHQLSLQSPKYPEYFFDAYPVHTVYEYIYQLACSASFWVGFSLIGLLELLPSLRSLSQRMYLSNTRIPEASAVPKLNYKIDKPLKRNGASSTSQQLRRNLKRVLMFAFLTVGFCVHACLVISAYSEYSTSMNTQLVYNENYTDVRTTVCISIDQLDLQGDYSLHNIWSKSPAPEDFLVECGYRGLQIPQFSHLPRNLRRRLMAYIDSTDLCNSMLRVKKFSTLGLICYQVAPGDNTIDTEYRTQHQIIYQRVYGYFIMSSSVSKYNLTVALSQGSPVNALLMPSILHRDREATYCEYFFLNYVRYLISTLPYPYEMGVYDSLRRIMCMNSCLHSKMKAMNIFSPYGTADDPSFLIHATANQSVQEESLGIESNCFTLCKLKKNTERTTSLYSATFSDGPYGWSTLGRRNDSTSIWLAAGNNLVTETVFYPELRFVDLVIFLGSLFAVWSGLSVLHLTTIISDLHSHIIS